MDRITRDYVKSADTGRWWAIGVWMRLTMIGGMMVPAGLLMVLDGGAAAQSLALTLGGAALAAVGWWRSKVAIGAVDDPESSAATRRPDAAAPRVSPSRRPA
jgi:hypothetical protein